MTSRFYGDYVLRDVLRTGHIVVIPVLFVVFFTPNTAGHTKVNQFYYCYCIQVHAQESR
jgi:hypothetical protein